MTSIKSVKGLQKQFDALKPEVKNYLSGLEPLLQRAETYDVAVAYVFMKLEEGHHRALKCGLVRLHRVHSRKADEALEKQHFTRKYFRAVFNNVVGKKIPANIGQMLESAEAVRDRQIHGKQVKPEDRRNAVSNAIRYMESLGELVESRTNKNPFGDLRGLSGKMTPLDETTSYWVCKGVGLFTNHAAVENDIA